jgi:hypothetical protein
MWWHNGVAGSGLRGEMIMRAVAALAIAALAGGCFQPLYADRSPTGGPVLRDQLSAVDILQIEAPKGTDEARLAVEIRNALLFDFTGGGSPASPTHKLKISMSSQRTSITGWSLPDRHSPACPTISRASSNASPVCAACVTPRAVRRKSSPTTSCRGSRLILSRGHRASGAARALNPLCAGLTRASIFFVCWITGSSPAITRKQ